MKTIAYLRVSTNEQDLDSQRLAILNYAHKTGIQIDRFIQSQASSRKTPKERQLDLVLEALEPGDTLIISELSRLGRSLGQIIRFVDELIAREAHFLALKENIALLGKKDIQTKVMITMFGLFAEIERDLISERTKEGMEKAKSKGRKAGRPKGKGKSRLDGREDEIAKLLEKGVSKSSMARMMEISRTALNSFIESRKLD
jgi:DNA invertase Pin-like site-specific DNA recombinase